MKLEELELSLLFDYYGELLTDKQRTCFELYYNQDYSLGEIAGEAGISRQAVYDTLARAESALRTMEGNIGAAARDLACRKRCAHPDSGRGPGPVQRPGDRRSGPGNSGGCRHYEGVNYGV